MMLQSAVNEFMIVQQIRGNTPKTLRYYTQSLGKFAAFASSNLDLSAVDLALLRSYYLSLVESGGLRSTSVQSYIRAVRAFLRWCYAEEYISTDLAEKFRLPKAKQNTIDVLTDTEVQRLLACFNTTYATQLRNYCMCSLMLDSGLRLHEVVTLSTDRLHLADGYAIVDGKGNKQRPVPLGLNTRRALLRYLNRRPACAPTDRVFLMSDMQPVTDNTVHLMFKRLKQRSDIPRLRAHLLRHTFATRYLENGGDIHALQQILGHTSLEMVKRYVHTTTKHFVPSFSDYSPLDNLLAKTS